MTKFLYTAIAALCMTACHTAPTAPVEGQTVAVPQPIGYDAYNAVATTHLNAMLSKTSGITLNLQGNEYALTTAETTEFLSLLGGVKSAATRCAPDDCFYLNMTDAAGQWLMSIPVQHTPQGIVLLYLKLQGNNAAAPLQNWWQGITHRLSL